MAHEDKCLTLLNILKVSNVDCIGEIMQVRYGIWPKSRESARNNAYKTLKKLASKGVIEQGQGYFRVKGCKSEYKDHSRLLTQALVKILKIQAVKAVTIREKEITEVGLRPDALVFLKKGDMGLCFVLEAVHNERAYYLNKKLNVWKQWSGAIEFLSSLFGYQIEHFGFVIDGSMDGYIQLDDILAEVSGAVHN